MRENRTLITILTWNRLKLTKKTLKCLLKYNPDVDILVVDNGSTDGTLEYLQGKSYDIIKNATNEGIFRASTKAWIEGVHRGYDFILNLQNDFPCTMTIPFDIMEKYMDDNQNVGYIRLNKKKDKARNMATGRKIRYESPEVFGKFSISKYNYHSTFNPSLIRSSIIQDLVKYDGDNPRERILVNNFATLHLKSAKLIPEVFVTLPQGDHKGEWKH